MVRYLALLCLFVCDFVADLGVWIGMVDGFVILMGSGC